MTSLKSFLSMGQNQKYRFQETCDKMTIDLVKINEDLQKLLGEDIAGFFFQIDELW